MKKFPLHYQIFLALPLAILYGLYLSDYIVYVAWMGDVFLRMLKMIILPLIISSIVSGITQIGSVKNFSRIGLKTLGYYITTSLLAIFTGLIFVNYFKPGVNADLGLNSNVENLELQARSFSDTLMNIIPTNIIESMSKGDILPSIFFFILIGYFITKSSNSSQKTLTNLFNSLFEVMMKITMFIINFAALGIFGIVAKTVAEQKDIVSLAEHLGVYMLVVLAGLLFHSLISLPTIMKIFRLSVGKHFQSMRLALLTAFSTSSSSATLPLTIESVENNSGVSNKISSFTLPLGATINMDGTALYELVAAMFIAQALDLDLSISQQLIAVFTALLASIGAAGIPMAGLVMISVILTAMGLPPEGVGLILAVDRILDMFRTTVNVWSDSIGACIIAKSEGEKLKI